MKNARPRVKRCATLADVRREIDRLDRRIVALLSERSGYVGEAARIKERASQIVDRARIDAVVGRARSRAAALGADPDTIARIYEQMIAAFIAYERRAFAAKAAALKTPAKKEKATARRRQDRERKPAKAARAKR